MGISIGTRRIDDDVPDMRAVDVGTVFDHAWGRVSAEGR